MRGKLTAWLSLVGVLIAIGYLSTYASSSSSANNSNLLYHYSTAIGAVVEYAVILLLVLWIAGSNRELLALRAPVSAWRAAGIALLVLVLSFLAIQLLLEPFLHGGREQGAVPSHWLPAHAGAYAANWFVVAVVDPFVEEVTYRGLGYSLLLERLGKWATIVAVGLLFAASHGLLQAFPELALLGGALAWLRSETRSVYPGMFVHGAFNSIALAGVFFAAHH